MAKLTHSGHTPPSGTAPAIESTRESRADQGDAAIAGAFMTDPITAPHGAIQACDVQDDVHRLQPRSAQQGTALNARSRGSVPSGRCEPGTGALLTFGSAGAAVALAAASTKDVEAPSASTNAIERQFPRSKPSRTPSNANSHRSKPSRRPIAIPPQTGSRPVRRGTRRRSSSLRRGRSIHSRPTEPPAIRRNSFSSTRVVRALDRRDHPARLGAHGRRPGLHDGRQIRNRASSRRTRRTLLRGGPIPVHQAAPGSKW